MSNYTTEIENAENLIKENGSAWRDISPENVSRMRQQNRFNTGLDIAKYTAAIMRKDMADYDADSSQYTQSLGCWHGFVAQQKMIAVKKHHNTTDKRYIYLSGWMIAALRSEFGPLPDQSMHEKTSVPVLIEEIYTFLKQADARELRHLFKDLDTAREAGDKEKAAEIQSKIDNFETHVVPIIADIDAGFGNEEATYLLAKKMIEAGACAIQIENQVSDEKQCGHQDGKVTVPHSDFLAKIRAVRYAFLELGVTDGVIVARTDSLGAGLTKQIAVTDKPGDLGDQYNSFIDCEELTPAQMRNGDVVLHRDGSLMRPKRLPSGLFQFKAGTGEDRCVLDSITSLQNGADLIWIETEKPHVGQECVFQMSSCKPSKMIMIRAQPAMPTHQALLRGLSLGEHPIVLHPKSQIYPLALPKRLFCPTLQTLAVVLATKFDHSYPYRSHRHAQSASSLTYEFVHSR